MAIKWQRRRRMYDSRVASTEAYPCNSDHRKSSRIPRPPMDFFAAFAKSDKCLFTGIICPLFAIARAVFHEIRVGTAVHHHRVACSRYSPVTSRSCSERLVGFGRLSA